MFSNLSPLISLLNSRFARIDDQSIVMIAQLSAGTSRIIDDSPPPHEHINKTSALMAACNQAFFDRNFFMTYPSEDCVRHKPSKPARSSAKARKTCREPDHLCSTLLLAHSLDRKS